MKAQEDFKLGLSYAKRLASMSGEVGFLSSCYIDLYSAHYAAKEPLTRYQRRVFDYLVEYSKEHGYAPTLTEIGAYLNYRSLASVHEHLESLQQKGWIRRSFNSARGTLILEGAA